MEEVIHQEMDVFQRKAWTVRFPDPKEAQACESIYVEILLGSVRECRSIWGRVGGSGGDVSLITHGEKLKARAGDYKGQRVSVDERNMRTGV